MRAVRSGWLPKTFVVLRGLTAAQILNDVQAGIVVGIVAIPLALAFAIASGVPPERGLVTAAVAGFLISLLGGSRVQIGGPTGAFVVIVYGIVDRKSTRLNSSHSSISYAVFCLKKKKKKTIEAISQHSRFGRNEAIRCGTIICRQVSGVLFRLTTQAHVRSGQ